MTGSEVEGKIKSNYAVSAAERLYLPKAGCLTVKNALHTGKEQMKYKNSILLLR